jgi:dUTP pyrophosphatase
MINRKRYIGTHSQVPTVEEYVPISIDIKDTVKVKKLHPDAKLPTYGSKDAAGADLYACIDRVDGPITNFYYIAPHETVKISTGIAMEIPRNKFGAIYARSGLSTREGLRPANCVGVIDSDYRGEIIVALHNDSEETRIVTHGDRIAQIIFQYSDRPIDGFEEVEELSETTRGEGGFGSTGKN